MRCAVMFAALMVVGAARMAAGQALAELVSPTDKIPQGTFKTWSLFLVCNPDWVAPERSAELADLYRRFRSFGDAIGRDNLAVWFWKRQMRADDPRLAENIDVARSAEFCGVLGRAPSQGPYLAVTSAYPDVSAFPAERAIFELGSLPPPDLGKLLLSLTDQLVLHGRVDAALAAAAANSKTVISPPSLWMRLLESSRQSLIGLGCAVKLSIAAGPLNAELRGCQ